MSKPVNYWQFPKIEYNDTIIALNWINNSSYQQLVATLPVQMYHLPNSQIGDHILPVLKPAGGGHVPFLKLVFFFKMESCAPAIASS